VHGVVGVGLGDGEQDLVVHRQHHVRAEPGGLQADQAFFSAMAALPWVT
jgi:hypothetical protein